MFIIFHKFWWGKNHNTFSNKALIEGPPLSIYLTLSGTQSKEKIILLIKIIMWNDVLVYLLNMVHHILNAPSMRVRKISEALNIINKIKQSKNTFTTFNLRGDVINRWRLIFISLCFYYILIVFIKCAEHLTQWSQYHAVHITKAQNAKQWCVSWNYTSLQHTYTWRKKKVT